MLGKSLQSIPNLDRGSSRQLGIRSGLTVFLTFFLTAQNAPAQGALWIEIEGLDTPRRRHAMAYDELRQQTIVFGGLDAMDDFRFLEDTIEWNGESWECVATTGPEGRIAPTMAYDSARGETILFGGYIGNSTFRDTWAWDGDEWNHLDEGGGPSGRGGHAMAFDSIRGKVVLFGGMSGGIYRADTWVWDGDAWSELDVVGPSPRGSHGMAFDSERAVVVLFGGLDQDEQSIGDTWEWDGESWHQASNSGPRARYRHGMAFDSARRRTVVFGGFGGGTLGDTWEWDGEVWMQFDIEGPPIRGATAMVYDSFRRRMVLAGGQLGVRETLSDAWELLLPVEAGPCGSGEDCLSGNCVDGACCVESACGTCETCNGPERPGQCEAVLNSADPDSCDGEQICSVDGDCVLLTSDDEPGVDADADGDFDSVEEPDAGDGPDGETPETDSDVELDGEEGDLSGASCITATAGPTNIESLVGELVRLIGLPSIAHSP